MNCNYTCNNRHKIVFVAGGLVVTVERSDSGTTAAPQASMQDAMLIQYMSSTEYRKSGVLLLLLCTVLCYSVYKLLSANKHTQPLQPATVTAAITCNKPSSMLVTATPGEGAGSVMH
jgi:hypothetical protein